MPSRTTRTLALCGPIWIYNDMLSDKANDGVIEDDTHTLALYLSTIKPTIMLSITKALSMTKTLSRTTTAQAGFLLP